MRDRMLSPDPAIGLLADTTLAVLRAPGMAIAVGITQIMPVLAALLITMCDRNSDLLAVHIRPHHGVVGTGDSTAAEKQRYRDGNYAQ
jgi:hypothetical protein